MSESYRERMKRLVEEAHLEANKYNDMEEPPLIAGRFTLEEMMEYRKFYKETGDQLFIVSDRGSDFYPNRDLNLREFFVFLLLPESYITKFLFDKYRQNNFSK